MIPLKSTDYTIQSIAKALDLLEIIAQEEPNHSLSFLSEQLSMSRNKTFRIAATLAERGLIERDGAGSYRLGIAAVELAQKILSNSSVISHAHPVMEELAKKHGEAVYMTVMQGEDVLFIDMVDCMQQVKAVPLVGKRFPFFSNAPGKAIKALESRDMREKTFKADRNKPGCPDFDNLESELESIRKTGVAVDIGGLGDGIISVAVAVKDYAGKVVGAITMLGPSFRMLAERLEQEIIPSLICSGEMLSGKFGYARI